ncbi:MAG TPA: class II fructose-bisphosphate aldolase [Chloroflexi bacterium]|jgi:ketose-bisphosphate aldolase|nr:class II fructose-bisphosphate aldolase [Chloroflexota bacterium]
MPLVSAREEIKKAQAGKYALPCFDTFEMLGTEGMFAAIEEKKAPAFVAVYTRLMDSPNARAFVDLIRAMAQNSTMPVSLILDHGGSYEHCIKALTLGFTDIMFDGSQLPIEENIEITRMLVKAAHTVGACVEAELGHVGTGADYDSFGGQGKGFTDPAAAERFVAETNVDMLAVAIGTAHGMYKGEPKIDLDLLAEIRKRVDVPLVLHGGSGLSEEQFRGAIEAGISKINIFTDLAMESGKRMVEVANGENASYFTMTGAVRDAFRDRCGYYLDLFGATGKADCCC